MCISLGFQSNIYNAMNVMIRFIHSTLQPAGNRNPMKSTIYSHLFTTTVLVKNLRRCIEESYVTYCKQP
jgi:hypothetical protein